MPRVPCASFACIVSLGEWKTAQVHQRHAGWEEVQLLDLHGIRTLLALGRITAGFLYELGVALQWEEVQLLARLGGWTPHEDRKPGKTTLTCGLRRLLDMLATRSYLDRYVAEHGDLPPRIAALLSQPAPEEL